MAKTAGAPRETKLHIRYGRGPRHAQVPLELLLDDRVCYGCLAVYVALKSYADFGRDTGARPSIGAAAKRAGMTRATFCKYRAKPAELSWIEWEKRPGRPSLYVVHGTIQGSEPVQQLNTPPVQSLNTPCITVEQVPVQSFDHAPETVPRASTESIPAGDFAETKPKVSRTTWLTPYWDAWVAVYQGEPNAGELARYLKPLHDKHGVAKTLRAWRTYLNVTEALYVSTARFSKTFGKWLEDADAERVLTPAQQQALHNLWPEEESPV